MTLSGSQGVTYNAAIIERPVLADVSAALDHALADLPEGRTLYALPTYTAMLRLRQVLVQRGAAQEFWRDR